MTDTTDEVERLGRQAEDSDAVDYFARAGLIAYGVVHLLLGWLAFQLALGRTGKNASTTGAMQELARQPMGTVLVWAVAIGIALLVIWRGLEVAFGHRYADDSDRWRKRAVSGAKAVIYAVIAVSAAKVALGSGSGSSGSGSKGITATVMGWPGGQWIVAAVGLAIVGYGGGLVWRGWQEKFTEDLDAGGRQGLILMVGKVGYVAKGISIGLVGGLFVFAGIDRNASESGGLDQALQRVLQAPGGPVLLALIGLGLACYGFYCFARSRHLQR